MRSLTEIIEVIQPIAEGPRGPHPENILYEIDVFKQMLKDFNWMQMDVDEKAKKRKTQLSLWKKWSYDEVQQKYLNDYKEYKYFSKCVSLYDLIQQFLAIIKKRKIGEPLPVNHALMRLKALLLIEEFFLDERLIPVNHVPIYLFSEIFKEVALKDEGIDGDLFMREYEVLYENWEGTPSANIYHK
jgi:hypothetical protein